MSRGDLSVMRNRAWILAALLLAIPSIAPHVAAARTPSVAPPRSAFAPQTASADADRDETASAMEENRQDQEREKRDREQEKRDREQEKRDREQEKRDREQERLDRQGELYENGREALDEDRYDRAEEKFDRLAQLNGKSPRQAGRRARQYCGIEAALSAKPLAEGCLRAGNRSQTIRRTTRSPGS